MKFRNLKLGVRLGAGFAVLLILLIAISAFSILGLRSVQANLDLVLKDRYQKVKLLAEINDALGETTRNLRNTLILADQQEIAIEVQHVEKARETIATGIETLKRGMASPEGRELMDAMESARDRYLKSELQFIELVNQGATTEARDLLLDRLRPQQMIYMARLRAATEYQSRRMDEEAAAADRLARNLTLLILGLALAAVVLGVGIGWWVARSIVVPIRQAVDVARTVARGDLTARVEVGSQDECGELMQALADMNRSLLEIVSQVRGGTETIATAANQIAGGNQDLSARTEQQASSLEETASSMEELTSTVKQNADNARQANALALSASDVAARGGSVVSEVVTTMGAINESSKKIVDIIGVIDGIAFQTNILALNAAVEAARAGEQGRGFAVVASEVRSLAQRSAAAAKEIKGLIDDSVGKVESGARLVDQAGSTMQDILGSVRRVTDIMSEIAAASDEQTAGIEQVNQAISQMDQMTQQNAALVEEAAAAAASMQEQSQALARTVGVFRTGSEDAKPDPVAHTGAPQAPQAVVSAAPATARRADPRPQPRLPASASGEWDEF